MSAIRYTANAAGPFLVYEAAGDAGAAQAYSFGVPTPRAEMPNTLLFVTGRWRYGPFPGVGYMELTPGMSSADLPDRPTTPLVLESLEAGSIYYCVRPADPQQRVRGTAFRLAAGERLDVAAGQVCVLGGGAYFANGALKSGVNALYARTGSIVVLAQEETFGLIASIEAAARTALRARAEKLVALAALRYQKETAGIGVGAVRVRTDRESQAQLSGAYLSLKEGLIADTPWKAADGWLPLTLAEIAPVAQAVAAHVRVCFGNERAHAQAIAQLPEEVAAIDGYDISTGWPA